ncbi:hypothetical protein [Paenibacillus sp.]|uniref:hypothetical protein n=1 Tax=Paenibacillus sp. TaxID=58172 RepID=UPI002811FFA6|nr:hypothetical protein [Paenibacillus sp.]
MAVVALLAVSILAFLSFVVKTKRLPALALVLCWMVAVFVKDAMFNVAFLNLKLVDVPPTLQALYLRMLNLYFVTPLIVVWAIDAVADCVRPLRKASAAAFAVAALLGVDFAMVAIGAWKPSDGWPSWLAFAEAVFVYATARMLTGSFRGLLRKEGVVR